MNWVFLFLVLSGTVVGALTGKMGEVSKANIDASKTAVDLAIGLVGQMALWLGVMKVLEEAGFLSRLSRLMRPVMARLFPYVPVDHPAMGAMILNLAANVLGLTNAATPFGIKAMIELDRLNEKKGVASNAMALFLAINTSGVAVLPTGVIAVRASLGAKDATGIFFPTLIATACSTTIAIIVCKLLERLPYFGVDRYRVEAGAAAQAEVKGLEAAQAMADAEKPFDKKRSAAAGVVALLLAYGMYSNVIGMSDASGFEVVKRVSADWILPLLMVTILLIGFSTQVRVYEVLVKGAKEGFNVAILILPFLVAILVAIAMFRASGAMGALIAAATPISNAIGIPPEVLPMAFIRPLSGSGALAVLMEIMKTHGVDSFPGFVASVMNGSFETTFYVLAVYYGAVGVRATRHTVWACLAADATGIAMSVVASRLFFSP